MAKKSDGPPPRPKLDRNLMEQLMFGTGRVRRFTQDSPVLPDVWLEYAKELEVKLLLTPYRENSTGDIRRELRERLTEQSSSKSPPRVVYNQSTVAATLGFEDLVRIVLPMTAWWERLGQWRIENVQGETAQNKLAEAVQDPEHPSPLPTTDKPGEERRPPPELLWMIRVVGALALVHRGRNLPAVFLKHGAGAAKTKDWKILVQAVADLIRGVQTGSQKARIYSVSLNREASPTVARSTLAVKADAARLLFNVSCRDLAWAVIDAGIDARHPAFRLRTAKDKDVPLCGDAFRDPSGELANCTRVIETYDFTQIDLLLDPETAEQPAHLTKRLQGKQGKELKAQLKTLDEALTSGRSIDWKLIGPLLRIPQDEGEKKYDSPAHDHGTHVAGILAGDWKRTDTQALEEDLVGVCPDLRLYDLRVLDKDGRGDEFSVMAALQFIRHLNAHNDCMVMHGVNLSMSVPHDVANFACGRTPVCEECERVVASGCRRGGRGRQSRVPQAADAGPRRHRRLSLHQHHRSRERRERSSPSVPPTAIMPHTYGVSYFSSRGPTGDGRTKPDLVAPGERI